MTPAAEKYQSYEVEVLVIIKSLMKFRVYLLAVQFKIELIVKHLL
jgi:hypothetical protein